MKTKFLLPYLTVFLILLSCKDKATGQSSTKFEAGTRLAEHNNKKLQEASGLAASVSNEGLLWTITDKGNPAEIYLIDQDLNIKPAVSLAGVKNRDWEDIAVGPGPDAGTTYIYVGDIGDNDGQHPEKFIYRIPEPKLVSDARVNVSSAEKITFKLDDGMKDAEALFIDGKTKNLFVISKRERTVGVYVLPYPQSTTETLKASRIHTLPFGEIVAADCNSQSGDILMKNYETVYHWQNTGGLDASALLKTEPVKVPYEKEPQGESIAWATDGSGFFTLSEQKKKQPSWLYFYKSK